MSSLKEFEHLRIPLQAIKLATNNFDDNNYISRGGFGKVYKGELVRFGKLVTVAVKCLCLDRASGQGNPEFWKEIMMLSRYKHQNLVSLLGFCYQDGESILVYEYLPNKSLNMHLSSIDLSWTQRLKICIGAAKGLQYLHNPGRTMQRVLHRDVKSSNILLDANWNAKISDFGLSNFGPANQEFTFLFTHPVGSFGYCDPLYVELGFLTKESDVYSFGVVLFEVLCGRLCIVNYNDNRRFLSKLAQSCYEENRLDKIVQGGILEQMSKECLRKFSTIAYQCLHKDRTQRPTFAKVVRELEIALQFQYQGNKQSRIPPRQGFNLPSQHLLTTDARRSEFFINTCVPLCKASIIGDWKAAKHILQNDMELVRSCITENYETTLHVAASAKNTNFVDGLVKIMKVEDLELQTKTGDTALCLAAASGDVKMATILVSKNENLLTITGREGLMPLSVAALYGNRDMVKYLYDKCNKMKGPGWKTSNKQWLLLKCIELNLFDMALEILRNHIELLSQSESQSILGVLARMPSAFNESDPHTLWRIIKSSIKPAVESEAMQLLREIWTNIMERPKAEVDKILRGPATLLNEKLTYSSHILFVAAEMGNTKFVVELIRKYPDIIWEKNNNNQSIFHIAVSHRCESIYNLLHEMGSMKDLITRLRDTEHNNMLHLVGNNAEKNQHQNVSGVAFQMQRELLWFKEVKSMIPPHYREEKNKAGLTPYELFTKNHKILVSKGEKWMKDTASQCMHDATLAAVVALSALLTILGDYNQNIGLPWYRWKGPFIVFAVLDLISLISSCTSFLVFLSILKSTYGQEDFLDFLPKKLLTGKATLFLSIVTMMVAFSVIIFMLFHEQSIIYVAQIYISIVGLISLDLLHHHHLSLDVFHSTYRSRFLFKPKKQLFDHQNPKL